MSSRLENPPAGPEPRRRKVLYAVLLALFVGMGAGQLYSGTPRRAMVAAVFFVFALALIPTSAAVPPNSIPGLLLGVTLAAGCLLILVGIVIDAGIGARRSRAVPEIRLRPVWVYALLFLASIAAFLLMAMAGHMSINRSMYSIDGSGMAPALLSGDLIFGYRGYYDNRAVQRGDIVVYQLPSGHPLAGRNARGGASFVKRVVGLPGETIHIRRGVLHINGVPVERSLIQPLSMRPFLNSGIALVPQYVETLPGGGNNRIIELEGDVARLDYTDPVRVPKGHVFVLGDNRDNSSDSRQTGPIPLASLTDRAEIVFWSGDFGRIGLPLHPN